MLAVDAGSHLAAITRILQTDLPLVTPEPTQPEPTNSQYAGADSSPYSSPAPVEVPPPPEPTILESGPFAGLPLPYKSARANAAHVVHSQVSAYLITHPHLDHLSGFAINTACFHATSRPKKLAALPFTVDAIKRHIFNDIIWPNLTDEEGGVGFVTFQRLKEGGDVMVGEGEGRGYIEVCEGLGVKGFKVSHGNCMKNPSTPVQRGSISGVSEYGGAYRGSVSRGSRQDARSMSLSHLMMPDTPGHGYVSTPMAQSPQQYAPGDMGQQTTVVDSTAYFIRDYATARELLIFGDVEPDSVSHAPQLSHVWAEAALKIAAGVLTGIFIECSYDDSQGDAVLFGHMAPRHLVVEMQVLANMVKDEKASRAAERAQRKRKRAGNGMSVSEGDDRKRSRSQASRPVTIHNRRLSIPDEAISNTPDSQSSAHAASKMPASALTSPKTVSHPPEVSWPDPPLKGLRVVIIHVKDTLKDGPPVGERILEQLNEHARAFAERQEELGCEFVVSESSKDYWF